MPRRFGWLPIIRQAPTVTEPEIEPDAGRNPLAPLNRSLIASTVLAALIVAATFWLGARNNSDDQWVLHSLEVRRDLTRVLSLVQSAETGQRGYLLTGRDTYLAPHQMAVEQLPPMLDHLQHLVSDNPRHLQNLAQIRQLIGSKLTELQAPSGITRPAIPMPRLRPSITTTAFASCRRSERSSRPCKRRRMGYWRSGNR